MDNGLHGVLMPRVLNLVVLDQKLEQESAIIRSRDTRELHAAQLRWVPPKLKLATQMLVQSTVVGPNGQHGLQHPVQLTVRCTSDDAVSTPRHQMVVLPVPVMDGQKKHAILVKVYAPLKELFTDFVPSIY